MSDASTIHVHRARLRRLSVIAVIQCLAAGGVLFAPIPCWGQKRPSPPRRAPRVVSDSKTSSTVTINYPDSVNLAAFVDYVAQSVNVQIVYDDEVRNQTVVFRPSEVRVPRDQLLDLLRSMLRMKDLALVEGDVGGWLRIIKTGEFQRHIAEIRHDAPDGLSASSNRIVTQILTINATDMQSVVQNVRGFLSSSKASVIEIPGKQLLIITDFESAIAKVVEIVELFDQERPAVKLESVSVRHQDAKAVAERVTRVLKEKSKLEGSSPPELTMDPDDASGAILLVGAQGALDVAKQLIQRFDQPLSAERRLHTYAPVYMTAARLQELIEGVILGGVTPRGSVHLFRDEAANRLYVSATENIQQQIQEMLSREDLPTGESSNPLRVYRPRNRLAGDLIATLSELLPNVMVSSIHHEATESGPQRMRAPPGPNRPPSPAGTSALPVPPAHGPGDEPRSGRQQVSRVEGTDFVLSHDEHTNAILAIGPREFHTRLRLLMDELDKRQPQVLIEMTLVAVTFNDSFSLAVELANEEKNLGFQSLLFSSFGLSNIDLSTGARTFNPGGGMNGVILGPFETPILLRAIAAHGNSRIITTPRAIVSDSTTATIGSVEEAPFTSINASDTVATTSFAGFESAGTTLTVTPHIAQGDHLSLDYTFSFSNFTGGGSVGVPPPRTTNSFSGSVEIPDGHTIIVGGLVTENEADSVTEVPILGRIPGIGVLFQSSDRARTKSRVFAFIRATILRDDRFADLKLISTGEIKRASLRNTDYPESEYLWMR